MITISAIAFGFICFTCLLFGYGLGGAVTAIQIAADLKDLDS